MMNPKTTNHQLPTGSITVPGGRLTVKVLEFLLKPLLNAQREAGRSEAKAQFEAWKARQRAAGVEFVDDARCWNIRCPCAGSRPLHSTTFRQERP